MKIDYDALAREGVPVVQAIERFRAEQGVYPEYLDELGPYLKEKVPAGWDYAAGQYLEKRKDRVRAFVRYDFHPGLEGWWMMEMEGQGRRLTVIQPAVGPTTLPAVLVRANALTQYERRIKAEPTLQENYRAKGLLLEEMGEKAKLEAFCRKTIADQPQFWWPRMVLAEMDERVAKLPATQPATMAAHTTSAPATEAAKGAAEEFVAWAEQFPSFTHYIYLAEYFDEKGDLAGAAEAIRRAVKCPLEVDWADTEILPRYTFEAARIAYEAKDYQLVLVVCMHWEGLGEKNNEASYLAWRSAASLAMGNAKTAEEDVDQALRANSDMPLWAGNLAGLKKAAAAGDTHYHYDCGATLGRWRGLAGPRER